MGLVEAQETKNKEKIVKTMNFLIIKSLIIIDFVKSKKMVGATGFEPVTPAVSRQCSTGFKAIYYLK